MGTVSLREALGLVDVAAAARAAALAFRGDPTTPPSKFGLSSLRILQPRLALATWAGRRVGGRRVPLYNLFCHDRPPVEEGWSVRVTTARDFAGHQATYDSHNGTDFAVPVGTRVAAAADGVVARVSSEFDRGGLKVVIDHGGGLVTTSNHLARALVAPGDRVRRGDVVALSGMSGLDGVAVFPWNAPHVHYNVWLDGEAVDPFAPDERESLWWRPNDPRPAPPPDDAALPPTAWDLDAVERTLASCLHPPTRAAIDAERDPDRRAVACVFFSVYYPTRFGVRPSLVKARSPRRPVLSLPFLAEDFDGVAWPTGRGWR